MPVYASLYTLGGIPSLYASLLSPASLLVGNQGSCALNPVKQGEKEAHSCRFDKKEERITEHYCRFDKKGRPQGAERRAPRGALRPVSLLVDVVRMGELLPFLTVCGRKSSSLGLYPRVLTPLRTDDSCHPALFSPLFSPFCQKQALNQGVGLSASQD